MHYSWRTERVYVDWIKRFILHHGKRHPRDMGAAEVEAFLSYLAVARNISASTQNQAKIALLFLYKEVLSIDMPWLDNVTQARHCDCRVFINRRRRIRCGIVLPRTCSKAVTISAPCRSCSDIPT